MCREERPDGIEFKKWGQLTESYLEHLYSKIRSAENQLDDMELKGTSRSMTNHIQKEIKCVFSYALHLGTIKVNPFAGMKRRRIPKKRKETLTHEETDRLLAEAKFRGHNYYYIWLLTLALGLR